MGRSELGKVYVIDQTIAALQYTGRIFDAFYLRTSDQREIDLLIQTDGELWAMEIKLTTNPRMSQMKQLEANADLVGADRRFLVCHSCDFIESGPRVLCSLEGLIDFIER